MYTQNEIFEIYTVLDKWITDEREWEINKKDESEEENDVQ